MVQFLSHSLFTYLLFDSINVNFYKENLQNIIWIYA